MSEPFDETRALTRPPSPARALSPGAALGPYEIVELLGAGGMGEVYRARDPRLGREVAVKVIRGSEPTSEALRRFDQEARAAGALNHPNLLAVYDVGVQDGAPFVVTELLEGETLRERLRHGPLPADEAIALLRQVLAGVGAAHQKGIVHRDLKPENLFLTADGRVKILDFGLAKRLEPALAGEESLTGVGTVLGTVGYTAPEQLCGQPALPASDLFALGAVLYEMVSGRKAFAGATALETIGLALSVEPPPLAAAGCLPACRDWCNVASPSGPRSATAACASCSPTSTRSTAKAAVSQRRHRPRRRARRSRSSPSATWRASHGSAHLRLGLADATITELAHHRALVVRPDLRDRALPGLDARRRCPPGASSASRPSSTAASCAPAAGCG